GSTNAIAPGAPIVRGSPGPPSRMVTEWEISASQYAHELAGTGFGVVVSQGTTTLGSTLRAADGRTWPRRGAMKLDKVSYRFVTQSFTGFGQPQVKVTVLSDLAATNGAVGGQPDRGGAVHRWFPAALLLFLGAGLPGAAGAARPVPGGGATPGQWRFLITGSDRGARRVRG